MGGREMEKKEEGGQGRETLRQPIRTTYTYLQMFSVSCGYRFRLSNKAWTAVLRPAEVVMRQFESISRNASRMTDDDSYKIISNNAHLSLCPNKAYGTLTGSQTSRT